MKLAAASTCRVTRRMSRRPRHPPRPPGGSTHAQAQPNPERAGGGRRPRRSHPGRRRSGVRRQVGRRSSSASRARFSRTRTSRRSPTARISPRSRTGWTVKHLDANLSPSKQVSDVDTFINLGVKGIITWTLDPGTVAAAYKRALAANIPIVDFGSTSNVTSTVYRRARVRLQHGPEGREVHQQRGFRTRKVLVVGGPPVPSITNYTNCFIKDAKSQGMTVLEVQKNVNDTAATAQPIVQSMLTKYPNADAIWCYNDPSALGAGAVVKSAGKTVWSGSKKGIIIEGANGSADAAAGIKQGVITEHVGSAGGPDGPPVGRAAGDEAEGPGRRPSSSSCPMKVWDASNIASYVDPLKRTVKLGAIPPTWIIKKG